LNSTDQRSQIIQTLDELVTSLSEAERTSFDRIIRSMNLPRRVYENRCSWSDDSYTRNCIVENEKFELILLCWEKGQYTPIHDHGGEECWVKVIEGEFKETIYQKDESGEVKIIKSAVAKTNDITYMIDFMGFHRLENLSNARSMTLHLYAKPIHKCNILDENSGKLVNKEMTYDTVSEK
jgi:cysteine dioxygenase